MKKNVALLTGCLTFFSAVLFATDDPTAEPEGTTPPVEQMIFYAADAHSDAQNNEIVAYGEDSDVNKKEKKKEKKEEEKEKKKERKEEESEKK